MIIEGKHAEVGHGIFVSDIQVGSAAELVSLLEVYKRERMYVFVVGVKYCSNLFIELQ